MGVDKRELDDFIRKLNKLTTVQKHEFMEQATRQCAARMLSIVIPATPVGDSRKDAGGNTTHMGGALRRAWTCRSEEEAESGVKTGAAAFSKTLDVQQSGKNYSVDLINPMHYASYVENGHRQEPGRYVPAIGKRLKASWVEGQFFLKKSEDKFMSRSDTVLSGLLQKYLKKVF